MQKAKTGRHLSLHICRRQRQETISLSAHLQKAKTGRHFSLEICRKQRQDVISLFRSAERKKKGRNLSLQICRKQRKDVTSLSNTQLSMPTTDRRRCDIKIIMVIKSTKIGTTMQSSNDSVKENQRFCHTQPV